MWLVVTIIIVGVLIALANGRSKRSHSTSAAPSPAQRAPSRQTALVMPARWVGADESVEIAGFSIPSGMIYLGNRLATASGGIENCLINPSLPVSRSQGDRNGLHMSYWPSYSAIQPSARRAYLEWLAGGRKDPGAYIGYVFLFFYGLERRLFIDRVEAEAPRIIAEVERLRSLYGMNASFASYSSALIEAARTVYGPSTPPPIEDVSSRGYEMPLDVRRYLGARIAGASPLSADDALIWVMSLPDVYIGNLKTRCFDVFRDLWRARYRERWPDGLRVRPTTMKLRAEYRAASGTFVTELDMGGVCDVAAIIQPIQPLRELAESCSAELGNYARLMGRKSQVAGRLEVALLLPKELWSTPAGEVLRKTRAALEQKVREERVSAIPVSELCSMLDVALPQEGDKIPIAIERQIAAVLDAVEIGFEPDRRYGASGLTRTGAAILFRFQGAARVDANRPSYVAARAIAEIAALAAAADKNVVASEIEAIQNDLREIEDLGPAERTRLMAHVAALLSDPPKQQGAFNRLQSLGEVERQRVTQAAMSAVLADGRVTPQEVAFLERLHKALGLSHDELYAALHRGAIQVDEPVSITSEHITPGVPIPRAAPRNIEAEQAGESEAISAWPAREIVIDQRKLTRVVRETAEVSALLANIFVDEAPQPEARAPLQQSATFPGLDAAHGELLAAILASPGIERTLFEDKARSLKLMPNGAFETINEWAFETLEESLLEDGDVIAAAKHLLPKLEGIGAAK